MLTIFPSIYLFIYFKIKLICAYCLKRQDSTERLMEKN